MKNRTILALGADIKNRFLIGNRKDLSFGPDIGDLGNAENFEKFKKALRRATRNVKPGIVACDLHPGYFSTRLANEYSLKLKAYSLKHVQHHHAHIASVMHEHNLNAPVIGVSFDGTGFGNDGNIWGGEFLLVDKKGFARLGHLKYRMMPGGEKVVREPWRMVLSMLGKKGIPFVRSAVKGEKDAILYMCEKDINSPLTSSAGRLFDACAALLGICERASYEAEGPIKLEAMCADGIDEGYEFGISRLKGKYVIDARPSFLGRCRDLKKGKESSIIATRFHNTMVDIIVKILKKLSRDTGIRDIVLSGGVFQNGFLKTKTVKKLLHAKFNVFSNEKIPVNDFNISLGQYHVSCSTGKN